MTDAAALRGRPRTADPSAIAATGLALFGRDGFESVTMEDVALAAGVSRPTLYRYFPSKSDIVWFGSERDATWLRTTLAASDPQTSPLRVLCEVLPELVRYDESELDQLRLQVRLITTVPAVQSHTERRMAEFTDLVAQFVADRTGVPGSSLIPQVASRCVWATSWAALSKWAADGDGNPYPWVQSAFSALLSEFTVRT